MSGFHETLFPLQVGFGATGGPERRTDIASLASGHEERNARWANARRSYDAGTGVRSLVDLQKVLAFFEESRGRLYGFRFRDPFDHSSALAGDAISAMDQVIGVGDGVTTTFQLKKVYGSGYAPYDRPIIKPVAASVLVAIDGQVVSALSIDPTSGQITLDQPPLNGSTISAGFQFDVPVRFDTDRLEFSLAAFEAGDIPSIPLVEIRL